MLLAVQLVTIQISRRCHIRRTSSIKCCFVSEEEMVMSLNYRFLVFSLFRSFHFLFRTPSSSFLVCFRFGRMKNPFAFHLPFSLHPRTGPLPTLMLLSGQWCKRKQINESRSQSSQVSFRFFSCLVDFCTFLTGHLVPLYRHSVLFAGELLPNVSPCSACVALHPSSSSRSLHRLSSHFRCSFRSSSCFSLLFCLPIRFRMKN